MLKPRLIPCLLLHQGGLVKTVNFKNPKYVGDPINAVKIFNEKEVDELMVIDIDASVLKREPDFKLIKNIASECRMPLSYGGGIKSLEQARRIIGLGVEKVAVSSAAIQTPELIKELSSEIGSQSIVVVVDIKKITSDEYKIYTHNATVASQLKPLDFVRLCQDYGAGEVVINFIDKDGIMTGYDMDFAKKISEIVTIPITFLGGAGSLEHFRQLYSELGTVGAAAGSLFVFKGIYKAVLINYPSKLEKEKLYDFH